MKNIKSFKIFEDEEYEETDGELIAGDLNINSFKISEVEVLDDCVKITGYKNGELGELIIKANGCKGSDISLKFTNLYDEDNGSE